MPLYESTFVVRQDASVHDVNNITKGYVQLVEKLSGTILKKESWGLRVLSHKIKKNTKGHYVMLSIDVGAEAIKELERQYKFNENIIVFLTLKVKKIEEGASIMMSAPTEVEAIV